MKRRGKEKERENQRGTTEERIKEGREPHQHCQRHRQLIIFFVQQPLPFSITTAPALHNEKEKNRGGKGGEEGDSRKRKQWGKKRGKQGEEGE